MIKDSEYSILDIPCAFCKLQGKCIPGEPLSPETCEKLEEWLDETSYPREICPLSKSTKYMSKVLR